MKKIILVFFIVATLLSCSKRIARPPVKGIVRDSITNLPLENVGIETWDEKSGKYISETATNKNGEFYLSKIDYNDISFIGAETPGQIFDFKINDDEYNIKTIKENSKYGFSGDTIFYNIKLIPLR